VVAVAAMAVVAAAEAAAGLEVAATAGSVDAEVAAGSAVAAGSEVAVAAAAGSVVGGPAAFPGVRAACAKCHDLTAGLTEDAVIGLEAPQAPKRRLRSQISSLPGATGKTLLPRRGNRSSCLIRGLDVIGGSCSRRRRPHHAHLVANQNGARAEHLWPRSSVTKLLLEHLHLTEDELVAVGLKHLYQTDGPKKQQERDVGVDDTFKDSFSDEQVLEYLAKAFGNR
jgi:hypothetical protein